MKIVIDIPDSAYEAYKAWDKSGVATVEQTIIAHGTPIQTGEWEKVTEAHEDIGYDRGFRDGYARCITEHVLIQKELADCGFVASAVLKGEKENT